MTSSSTASDRGSIGLRKTWFIPCTLFGAAAYLSLALFEPEIATLWMIIGILIRVKTTYS